MVNNISLRPHPATVSYLKHFQLALFNFNLYIEEEKLRKRQQKAKTVLRIT
jgi:hypothetical protein